MGLPAATHTRPKHDPTSPDADIATHDCTGSYVGPRSDCVGFFLSCESIMPVSRYSAFEAHCEIRVETLSLGLSLRTPAHATFFT